MASWVCVCERERERVCERECVSVRVCVRECVCVREERLVLNARGGVILEDTRHGVVRVCV